MIEELNRQFGIENAIAFNDHRNGLAVIAVSTPRASAEICLQGAQVISFCPTGQAPVLWLSDDAVFEKDKAIRGGVPVCWPWFGMHPDDPNLPQHGFARTSDWQVLSTSFANDAVVIRLSLPMHLPETVSNAAVANAGARLESGIEIRVGRALELRLTTVNHGDDAVLLSQALHSYFSVSDIEKISITGLDGCTYYDKTERMQTSKTTGALQIGSETDRVYLKPAKTVSIHDPALNRIVQVHSANSESCVVWNPWQAKAKSMADFTDDGYKTMVCVESTHAMDDARRIGAGGSVELSQKLCVVSI